MIVVTSGEPAGIGPDICLTLAAAEPASGTSYSWAILRSFSLALHSWGSRFDLDMSVDTGEAQDQQAPEAHPSAANTCQPGNPHTAKCPGA